MSEPTLPEKSSNKPEPPTVPNHTTPPPYQGPTPPPAAPAVTPPQEMVVTLRRDPNESKRHPLTILFVVIGFIVGLLLGSIFTAAGSALAHHDDGNNRNRYEHSQPFGGNNSPGSNQNGNSENGEGNTVNPGGPQLRDDSGSTDSGKNSGSDKNSQGTDSSSKDSAND